MIDGILLINKEVGITSYDVIRRLKKTLPKGQKIGHAGSLDPFASGLLVILLGRYTKKMNEILQMKKEYIVTAEFGYATDTQDSTGTKTHTSEDLETIPEQDLMDTIQKEFIGDIDQTPPIYSAVKFKGQRAYKLARENKEVVLKPKTISIYEFEIVKYDWPKVEFRIICSSGTYIRTLVHDLGLKKDTYATAVALQRTKIGEYSVTEATDSEKIDINSINIINE